MEIGPRVPGAARLHLADGIPLLRPEEQVFTAMLEGWRNQQLARNLALATIAARERAVRAFTAHADAFPWLWTATMLDEWLGDLRAVRGLRRSTLRGYQEAIRMLCLYLTDPAYGWTGRVRDPVRHPPGPGGARVEHRGARPAGRGRPGQTRVHPRRAAGLLRPRRRARSPASGPPGARAGCRRSATPPCSRSPTGTGCGATRPGCWTSPTSAPTRTRPSSASTGSATSATARP